ncbi:MAG: tRNA 4-thiouridine(8) synthase ThiI [Actinobacteria bacterium]|nr:tRNA 4-thiouridine(8) synthase ThiI [Actinomycetota bacterium]
MRTTPTASRFLQVVGSPEIFLKSRPTRIRFIAMLTDNVRKALEASGAGATVTRTGIQEMRIDAPDLEKAAAVVATVFGTGRISLVESVPYDGFDDLTARVADATRDRVAGKTFAVRVKRSGDHDWSSLDAERAIGSLLFDAGAGVDLDDPAETVRVRVTADGALLVRAEFEPANGLPLGTQEPALALLSGGIDSPVAAWMMMRTGCPVDFLHIEMECSVTDQALAVGHELVRSWSHGSKPRFHVVDFQPVKAALRARIDPRLRQVLLKRLMLQTAEQVAIRLGVRMLVTGDSLGQVSSQTGAHLVELDRSVDIPIIRPLVALRKEEIIAIARRIGTFDMSIRTKEVCDLSGGSRVATRASARDLAAAAGTIEPELMETVLGTLRTVEASRWTPGMPFGPVG